MGKKIFIQADYNLKTIRRNIEIRQSLGLPVSGEIELYKAWIKYPDYALADRRNIHAGLYQPLKAGA